jgi:two-component system, cell cycle sensor histidine kinase and response regulator CckA
MNLDATLLEAKEVAVPAARILVVEDERIVARSLGKQLTTLGYEVVASVGSGEEAIQQAGVLRPDLVLMDIGLDGPMDGVEAAGVVRKQFGLPVVYLTAYSNKEIVERAKITEPFGYILKPFDDRELHVAIETAVFRHQMERRQQEREQWLVATLKSIGDAVVVTDEGGLITYLNPMAERLTGWSNLEANGHILQVVVRVIDKGSRKPVEFPLGKEMHHGMPTAEILLIAKDGSEKSIEDCIALITNEKGRSLGRVVVFRDVTWRKNLAEQFRQAEKLEAIGRLAGGVAHALNNLMTTALGHSEIMLDGMKPDNPFLESAQAIKRSAARTATLTQRLLAFARKQLLRLRPVNLNTVISHLAQAVRYMHGNVRLDLILEPGLGSTNTDADQLEEALLTLVRNASEAMPHGGRVTIQTANVELGQDCTNDHPEVRPGPYVLLAISDSGVGMAQDAINHLFEPFYTKETGIGAGLGLAAVYGFVKQCGGDIEVRSQPEKGTTFRLYLPREVGRPIMKNEKSSMVPIGPQSGAPVKQDTLESSLKTQSEIEAAICQGISHFEQEYMGRGPKDIHVHLIGDLLVVRLHGVLTAAEEQLVKSLPAEKGRTLLKLVRGHLVETARPILELLIRDVTGVPMLSLHHDVSTVTGEEIVLFTLAEPPLCGQAQYK